MVQAFVGLVGGGKSYNSVRRMMSYISKGGRVASNIELAGWDEVNKRFTDSSPVLPFLRSLGWEYQPGQYTYIPFDDMVADPFWFKRIPAGLDRDHRTLCVVDEATDLFDSLDGGKLKSDTSYRELFRFLRLSRHAHVDVLFICQDLQSINTRLRGLVAGIWRSTDMKGFKLKGIPIPFPFNTFLLQLFDRTGRNLIQREWVPKDPRVFTLYQSEVFGGALGVKWSDSAVGDGKIRKVDAMTIGEKILFGGLSLVSLLIGFAGIFLSRGDAPSSLPDLDTLLSLSNEVQILRKEIRRKPDSIPAMLQEVRIVETNSPSVSIKEDVPDSKYLYGNYRLRYTPRKRWVEFDGKLITQGCPSAYGHVVFCHEDFTLCRDQDGALTYLLPSLQNTETLAKSEMCSPIGVSVERP